MAFPRRTIPVPRQTPVAASIPDMIEQSSSEFPNKELFVYRRADKRCAITFAEFRALVSALSHAFAALHLPNFHVGLIGSKCPEWVATYFAVVAAGGVIVPLDRELSLTELPGFLESADCDAVVYTDAFAEAIESKDARLKAIQTRIFLGLDQPAEELLSVAISESASFSDPRLTFGEFARLGAQLPGQSDLLSPAPDLDRLAAILFTSGTTGTAKGVMLSQRSLIFCVNQSIRFVDITDKDTLLSVLPLHHTYEMAAGIFSPILVGATICINDKITSVLTDFRRYRPTMMAAVPLIVSFMYKKIMETARKEGKEKTLLFAKALSGGLKHLGIDVRRKLFSEILLAFGGRFSKIMSGGAAIAPELIENMEAFGIRVQQGYGITECAPVIAIISYDVNNPASCGRLLPGMQIFLDKEEPGDETGEICVKGENVMLGYYKNEKATRAVLSPRGWFFTGDCGKVDENGYLYITGRKKNIIILANGENVFPEELEEPLSELPFVKECMVCERSRADGAKVLCAMIFPDYQALTAAGLTESEEILDYFRESVKKCNRSLAGFRQIKKVEVRKTPFPMTSTHKIRRHLVTEEKPDTEEKTDA